VSLPQFPDTALMFFSRYDGRSHHRTDTLEAHQAACRIALLCKLESISFLGVCGAQG